MIQTGKARTQSPSFTPNIFACAAIRSEAVASEFRDDAIIIACPRGWRWKKEFSMEPIHPKIVSNEYGVGDAAVYGDIAAVV